MAFLRSPRTRLTAACCTGILALAGCGSSHNAIQEDSAQNATPIATSAMATPSTTSSSSASSSPHTSSSSAAAESHPAPVEQDPAPQETVEPAEPEQPARGSVTVVDPEDSTYPDSDTEQQDASASNQVPAEPTHGETQACDYGQIHISANVAPGGGAAGSRYLTLTYTNSGNTTCSLSGYPSVNYVDDQGNQIGASARQAAEWTSSGKVLNAGESASATLRETRAGLYDATGCQPTTASGYRVSIPGTSSSLIIHYPAEACSNTAAPQLSVGQVGANAS